LQKELDGKTEPDKDKCETARKEAEDAQKEYQNLDGGRKKEIERLGEKYGRLTNEDGGLEESLQKTEEDCLFAKSLRGDSGTGLQRYVLGIMFSSVVRAANHMLEKVHGGRYSLRTNTGEKEKGKRKEGLDILVHDIYSEENEGRPAGSLSGGEKFLVSLALAIGMSSVAQKSGIRIEALFIDEGFGTLDDDSVEDAMDILNSVQKANGLVGIISHVELLMKNIPCKLKVKKTDKGSAIEKTIG
ncbi:MAG: hypothetical protein ILO36_03150, partial [Abditibacteriota bacterium]|nr:hypothetical protein [Abditibacteriota bacterium]